MGKMNVSLNDAVQYDLQRLIPARQRSLIIKEALRKETPAPQPIGRNRTADRTS